MLRIPDKPQQVWTCKDVLTHLEFAVNLELWTIPYYMTAMYSIREPAEPVFRMIQSVVHQEMLHAELAANVYNAFQPKHPLKLGPFEYTKEGGVPHLDFNLDPEALKIYGEPNAELGGLDQERINTMCLIELPETKPPPTNPNVKSYATIGDFYRAIRYGMAQNAGEIVGGHNQVDIFANYYRNLDASTVTENGERGLSQALVLIETITEQGEGLSKNHGLLPERFRNTADGYNPASSHFKKFNAVRDGLLSGHIPALYEADASKKNTAPQKALTENFKRLITQMTELFNGETAGDFGALMPTIGANILTCWREGLIPQYSLRD